MDLLSGLPRAAKPTSHEGTREQIQMSFFNDLITAESHYLTTDSEIMQRREVPPSYNLMLSFHQACIFFYVLLERLYWIPECICEWDQLKENDWNPADDMSEFPDIQEKLSFISPSNVDTRLVEVLNESKHVRRALLSIYKIETLVPSVESTPN